MSNSTLSQNALVDSINPPKPRSPFIHRFIFLSPQITILSLVALVLLISLIVLAVVVVEQEKASAEVLATNDTNRVFVQLQRETLRFIALVSLPASEYDEQKIQTQHDLIESRIGVMNFPATQATIPDEIRIGIQQIAQDWDKIKEQIRQWQDTPDQSNLRANLKTSLTNFEILINDTEIQYVRINNHALTDFAKVNQQQLISFATGGVFLVLFLFGVAISIYRFYQQRREVEAIRESNRLKDEFVATVSHELRTPLNAIIGFQGIIKMKGGLAEDTQRMLDRAQANAQRLLALINDILDMSKIEAGKFEFLPVTVPIAKMVDRWQSHVEVLANQKELDFQVRIAAGLPETVTIDEEAVTKVATNLLSNAFKFTEKGTVSLDVSPGEAGEWLIAITDTGIGIPESAIGHIFESFRQVDGSMQRAYGGTGLGLSIVQRLCQAMGGDVQVKSTLGQGSTFTVRLPLRMQTTELTKVS
jgi:signal transduction histidine kinase